jgi:hypothetical protein
MTAKPKQLLTAFGLAGGLVLASAPAHATFILDTSCGVSKCAEGTDFFIDNANADVSTFTGTVGLSGPAVTVFTAGNVDTRSDFATITPATGILTVLIFTPADDTLFNGFSFRGQLAAAGFLGTVDVSWLDSNGKTGSVMFTGVKESDADFDRLGIVSDDGETLRRVAVSVPPSEAAGERFKEFEQIELSSVTPVIPEPSTWVMMLLGFAGLGFVGYRAARKATQLAPKSPSAGPRLRELRQPGQSYSDVNLSRHVSERTYLFLADNLPLTELTLHCRGTMLAKPAALRSHWPG